MTEADLGALFDIQDDRVAQQMAAFISPASADREAYIAKMRRHLADEATTNRVVVVDDTVVGSVACFVIEGDTELTYWIRRDLWGRGVASSALAAFLAEISTRPMFARVAGDNLASARVLERNGFHRVGAETSFATARGADITEYVYRLDAVPPATAPASS